MEVICIMDVSLEQIWGAVITTAVGIILRLIFMFVKEQREKRQQEEEHKNQIISELMKNNQELIDWKSDMANKNSQIEAQLTGLQDQMRRISENDLILMKDKILHVCGFFLSQGTITLAARENLTEMYRCYQHLGGNGTCKLVYEQTMALRVKDILLDNKAILDEEIRVEMKQYEKSRKKRKQSIPDTTEQNN